MFDGPRFHRSTPDEDDLSARLQRAHRRRFFAAPIHARAPGVTMVKPSSPANGKCRPRAESSRVPGENRPVFAHQRCKTFQDFVLGRFVEINHDVATEQRVGGRTIAQFARAD